MSLTSTNGTPTLEVTEKATRRRFTAEYKQRILDQYDRLPSGERGALLRREGLYSSHLDGWRKLVKQGGWSALGRQKRGRKPNPAVQVTKEVTRLQRENARLERKLKRAEAIIEIQKKVALALQDLDAETNESEGDES